MPIQQRQRSESRNTSKHCKAHNWGRTNQFSNILVDHEFSAGCYLLKVSISGLLFSRGWPSHQLLLFFACDLELWRISLTFGLCPGSIKVHHHAKCLSQTSFSSKGHKQTHIGPTAQLGPLKRWVVVSKAGVWHTAAVPLPCELLRPAASSVVSRKWQW